MPLNSESTLNAKLAESLRSKHPNWTVGAEQTGVFVEKQKKPDIVVSRQEGLTVVIETEVEPATTVESDASARLGQEVRLTAENG